MKANFNLKQFVIIVLITSIWINVSEVFRYFIFVMPEVKSFFDYREGVAAMDGQIFFIWGLWDTLLTFIVVFFYWLFNNVFGDSNRTIFASATIVWLAMFVIFWVATANMGLSKWSILLIALPFSWIEMVVGTWITSVLYKRKIYG